MCLHLSFSLFLLLSFSKHVICSPAALLFLLTALLFDLRPHNDLLWASSFPVILVFVLFRFLIPIVCGTCDVSVCMRMLLDVLSFVFSGEKRYLWGLQVKRGLCLCCSITDLCMHGMLSTCGFLPVYYFTEWRLNS